MTRNGRLPNGESSSVAGATIDAALRLEVSP